MMVYPDLVPKRVCKTDIHVKVYSEELTEEGTPEVVLEAGFKCNYQDSAKTILTTEKKLVQISGTALFCGDIAPDIPVISDGEVVIFGVTRKIASGTKNRNPDGTVNYTRLDVM